MKNFSDSHIHKSEKAERRVMRLITPYNIHRSDTETSHEMSIFII